MAVYGHWNELISLESAWRRFEAGGGVELRSFTPCERG